MPHLQQTSDVSGNRQAKARSVFGDALFEEVNSSLSYTPSPRPASTKTQSLNESTSSIQSGLATVLFSVEENNTTDSATKRISFTNVEGKENVESNQSASKPLRSALKKADASSRRKEELNRLRAANAQSPLRRDLVKRTQAAISTATTSVNQSLNVRSVNKSLNATKKAKNNAFQEKANQTKKVRFQWQEEFAEAKSFNTTTEENRRQILHIQRKIASQHFKNKAHKDEVKKQKRIALAEENIQFNSEVFRDHQKKLKEERDTERKQSMDTRAKLRVNKREGEERLQIMKGEEEQAIFEVRYDLHKAQVEAKKESADQRRQSFLFRGGDAKRIRNLRSEWKEEDIKSGHESSELSRAAERDADNYKKKMDEERRQSLAGRGHELRRQREEQMEQLAKQMSEDQQSYELKFAGERDANAYREKMNEERRKSLAGRNKESARHGEVMKELRNIFQEREAESYVLKWAGDNDAKAYLAKVAEERRQSLHMRGQEHRRQRQYDDEQNKQEVMNALADGALQSECQKDVENYKTHCDERDRKSLQFRGKEKTVQRMEDEARRLEQLDAEHKGFELDSLARTDVGEYIKDCQKSRRKSLACRAKEKRRHAEWKRQQEEKELGEQVRTTRYRTLDRQQQELARQKERARMAMDALLAAGCSLKGNPFAGLLDP
jgi:hypothetical protein